MSTRNLREIMEPFGLMADADLDWAIELQEAITRLELEALQLRRELLRLLTKPVEEPL